MATGTHSPSTMPEGSSLKRSVSIRGHRTSISLEARFWDCLQAMAAERGLPLAALVAEIDTGRDENANLSSLVRLAVLDWALRRDRDVSSER